MIKATVESPDRPFWLFAAPLAALLAAIPWMIKPCGIGWDNGIHRRATIGWIDAWHQGVAWPSYINTPNAGLGSFWPYYYPPLFHVSTAVGMAAGLDFWRAAMTALLLAQAAGAALCFKWLRGRAPAEAASVGAVVFALAPYPFLNAYLRGAFPEGFAVAWLPGVFWGVDRVHDRWGWRAASPGIGAFALVSLANLPALLVCGVATAVYVVARAGRSPGALLRGLGVPATAMGLTAFFWMAAWLDAGMVQSLASDLNVEMNIRNSLRFAAIPSHDVLVTGLHISAHFIMLLGAILAISGLDDPRRRGPAALGAIIVASGLWLSFDCSWFMYQYFPVIHRLQFSWRFLATTSVGLALLAASAATESSSFRRKATMALILAAVMGFDAYVYFGNTFTTDLRFDAAQRASVLGDYLPRESSAPDDDHEPFPKVQATRDGGVAEAVEWKPGRRTVSVREEGPLVLTLATYADPRWEARDQDGRLLASGRAVGGLGLLGVAAPAGTSLITVTLKRTDNAVFAAAISLLCAMDILFFLVFDSILARRGRFGTGLEPAERPSG